MSKKKHAGEVLQEAEMPSRDAEGPTSQEHWDPTDLHRDLSQSPWPLCCFPVYSYLFLMKGGADAARPAHLTDGWED